MSLPTREEYMKKANFAEIDIKKLVYTDRLVF